MARGKKKSGLTPNQLLDETRRRDMAEEVWGRFWEEARTTTNVRGQLLTRQFAEAHSSFGLDNLLAVLSAGHTVGNLMMALRGTALGREICSSEIDALMRIMVARQGPQFFFQYLPGPLTRSAETLTRHWKTARQEIIGQARNRSAAASAEARATSTPRGLAGRIRAAYPDLDELAALSAQLEEDIELTHELLRTLAELIAGRELLDALRAYTERVRVGRREIEDNEMIESIEGDE